MDLSQSDKDNIAATAQAVRDLKENLPLIIEVAASKGAEKALSVHAPVLEKLTDRVSECEKEAVRLNTAVKTLRWAGAALVAVAGATASLADRLWK